MNLQAISGREEYRCDTVGVDIGGDRPRVLVTGSRAGSDVVQVYVAPPDETPVFRPRRELKGFGRVHLAPDEGQRIAIDLQADADRQMKGEGPTEP